MAVDEIWYRAGQAAVVRHLADMYERQQELNMDHQLQGVM